MKTIKLFLFRITVLYDDHILFWGSNSKISHIEVLESALKSVPDSDVSRGDWAIGNLEMINAHHFYFRFGKTRKVQTEKYVKDDFVSKNIEMSESTDVFIDTKKELLLLAHNYKLSQKYENIANNLALHLKTNSKYNDNILRIKIEPIRRIDDVIRIIRTAHSITEMKFTFSKSNPDDMKHWMGMFQAFSDDMNLESGETKAKGSNLNKGTVEYIAQSINVSNNTGHVKYQEEFGGYEKIIAIHKQTPISIITDEHEIQDRKTVFVLMHDEYNKVNPKEQ